VGRIGAESVSITSRVIDNESIRQSLEASARKTFEEKTHAFKESYCRISELSSIITR
jgi:hypothetical protein